MENQSFSLYGYWVGVMVLIKHVYAWFVWISIIYNDMYKLFKRNRNSSFSRKMSLMLFLLQK